MKYYEVVWGPTHLFQRVIGEVCISPYLTPCLCCGEPTEFITYHFPRPAIPVCSTECHLELEKRALPENNY